MRDSRPPKFTPTCIITFAVAVACGVALADEGDAVSQEDSPYIVLDILSQGEGQSPRLLLEYLQVPYEDVRYTKEEWPKFKQGGIESGKFAEQLPSLTFA